MKKPIIPVILLLLISSFSRKQHNVYKGFRVKDIEKSMVLIPKGIAHCCNVTDINTNFIYSSFNFQKSVDSFYICRHEVSNGEYLEFVNDLYTRDSALYKLMLPDTLVWRERLTYSEPYSTHYFRHPAYRDYPVVGVSYEQAEKYCEWLTEKYMNSPKRKYKSVRFRLPEIAQWAMASGGRGRTFPFGEHLQNEKGQALANFKVFLQGSISRVQLPVKLDGDTLQKRLYFIAHAELNKHNNLPEGLESGFITTPVESYWPDKNGLYNLAGNVEEYIREKGYTKGGSWNDPGYYLQNLAEETYDSTNYTSAERGFRYVMEISR
jgi:sulfatase modifying factor 1